MSRRYKAYIRAIVAALFLGVLALPLLPQSKAAAAQLENRSLTLVAGSGGSGDGGSKPNGLVDHLFRFSVGTTGTIGSISLQYCTTAANTASQPACVTPDGLHTTSTSLTEESGNQVAGFTLVSTTDGKPYLTRTASSATSGSHVYFTIHNVTNPTDTNTTFFVRIATYASTDITGLPTDSGNVTASTANQMQLSGTMPESLVFCTGQTITTNAGGAPDCATATQGTILFDRLFSPTDTATATSQMMASTNATFGYIITVNGSTLASGSNTVTPMTTVNTLYHGVSQFGLNLVENTSAVLDLVKTAALGTDTPLGTNVTPAANPSAVLFGRAAPNYDTQDSFRFVSGETVADSNSDAQTSPHASDSQIYTVGYVVDVPGSQPAGTYTTILTYICTPTF